MRVLTRSTTPAAGWSSTAYARSAARSWAITAAAAFAAIVMIVAPVGLAIPAARGPSLDVAVVQGSVPLELASDRLLQTGAVAESHIRLHRTLASDPPDLAVWPENALPEDPAVDKALGREVAGAVAEVGSPALIGALADAPPDRSSAHRLYNQVLLYSGDGQITGRYSKLHLVPGGEYVPWPRVLGWTNRYRRGNAVLAPGRDLRLFAVKGLSVGTPICFENVFPDLFRRFVARGAGVVVLITNDSSFLFSEASREHVIISQIRAVETGRWVVQAAVSGESAVIDPSGVVRAHTRLFERTILRARVPSSSARTLYVRFGDWFPWACGLGVAIALAIAWVRRRRHRRLESPPPGGPSPTFW